MTLDLSLGEFTALTAKALRGAGYTWGMATDGAYAARVLAQCGFPSADMVVRLLGHIENRAVTDFMSTPDWHLNPNVLCPLAVGAALADLGEAAFDEAPLLLESQSVLEPLLVAPALQRCSMYWTDGRADIADHAVHLVGNAPRGIIAIRIGQLGTDVALSSPKLTRAAVDKAAYESLLEWAARTYAPASDESRDAGAGAGTTDND